MVQRCQRAIKDLATATVRYQVLTTPVCRRLRDLPVNKSPAGEFTRIYRVKGDVVGTREVLASMIERGGRDSCDSSHGRGGPARKGKAFHTRHGRRQDDPILTVYGQVRPTACAPARV